jgi:hypothetical protein
MNEFFDYLRYDIRNTQGGGLEAAADPLIANLSNEECESKIIMKSRNNET